MRLGYIILATALLLSVDRQTFYSPLRFYTGPSAPSSCNVGDIYTNSNSGLVSICKVMNTWVVVGVPSGSVIFFDGAACPPTYTISPVKNPAFPWILCRKD